MDAITVFEADTDASPYSSSTTFVTGKAVEKCALELRERICMLGAKLLGCEKEQVEFDGKRVFLLESVENEEIPSAGRIEKRPAGEAVSVSLQDIVITSMCGNDIALETTCIHSSQVSPPPFMVGAAEVELDS